MVVKDSELYKLWALRLALIISCIVVSLSWLNAVSIPDLIIRAGVSFGVMYLLLAGTLSLYERTAPEEPPDEVQSSDPGRGGLIDISVGDDELQIPRVHDTKFAGQVDPGLSGGIADGERQAEIVRRMGWGDEREKEE